MLMALPCDVETYMTRLILAGGGSRALRLLLAARAPRKRKSLCFGKNSTHYTSNEYIPHVMYILYIVEHTAVALDTHTHTRSISILMRPVR